MSFNKKGVKIKKGGIMTTSTSLFLYEFRNSINRIVLDKNFDPNNQEVKVKLENIFLAFKQRTEQLSYGKELLQEGESSFKHIMDNLDKIAALSKKTRSIRSDQKV